MRIAFRKFAFTACVVGIFLSGAANAQVDSFQLPADENTYVVTYDLRGLECVQDVGGVDGCAVTNQAADEGGYPWTKVNCRPGDVSVDTFAWSLDNNKPMNIFEAPASLIVSAKLYKINVRLGRTCMKSKTASGGH